MQRLVIFPFSVWNSDFSCNFLRAGTFGPMRKLIVAHTKFDTGPMNKLIVAHTTFDTKELDFSRGNCGISINSVVAEANSQFIPKPQAYQPKPRQNILTQLKANSNRWCTLALEKNGILFFLSGGFLRRLGYRIVLVELDDLQVLVLIHYVGKERIGMRIQVYEKEYAQESRHLHT